MKRATDIMRRMFLLYEVLLYLVFLLAFPFFLITGLLRGKYLAYFPFDFTTSVKRFLDHHRPRVFAAMETEIWPNVTRLSRARGVRLILANGRLSDRSFPRYRALAPIVKRVLRHYDRVMVRDEG